MNYYVEMIKDFVTAEIKKPDGVILDDGEFTFACGMAFNKLTKKDRKVTADKKRAILMQITTLSLLKIEMTALIKDCKVEEELFSQEERNLFAMIQAYSPKADVIDAVLKDSLNEALSVPELVNKYARQEKYSKKVGIVSKTYKLNEQVVNDFAKACQERGVSLGPTLTALMLRFIEEGKE